MATLFKRLPVAPDPALQEPAGESELDSLYHRLSRPGLGTDGTMPSRGTPPACGEIPNDAHSPDTRHLGNSAIGDAAATVKRSRSPSPSSDDNHDYAFDGLHGTRKSTSPPTPECDGSPSTIGIFEFGGNYERAPTFNSTLPDLCYGRKFYEPPPDDRLPPKRRRRTSPRPAMIENKDCGENALIIPRNDGYFHFACPFYIPNPEKYKSCLLRDDLQSIDDLTKHLVQNHKTSPYYPICRREFESPEARDQHVLTRSRTVQNSIDANNINERQRFWLHKRDAVQLGERGRWSRILNTIFPETLPLKPSYLYEIKDRAMAMITGYWENADVIMSNEQLNDLPRLYSFILQIPGAFYGLVWGDFYNERKKIRIQDIVLGEDTVNRHCNCKRKST
ncbi:unnamed protein product [Clonostachys solani]|uniref:Uncharacterized protein n=1 Tax=Clonostachys solani TaxID=160281 RepID=A0A9N9ZM72_9HYPO|nr:unnamed protein product [Clonostachys solani]